MSTFFLFFRGLRTVGDIVSCNFFPVIASTVRKICTLLLLGDLSPRWYWGNMAKVDFWQPLRVSRDIPASCILNHFGS